jgi:hypothetical protein
VRSGGFGRAGRNRAAVSLGGVGVGCGHPNRSSGKLGSSDGMARALCTLDSFGPSSGEMSRIGRRFFTSCEMILHQASFLGQSGTDKCSFPTPHQYTRHSFRLSRSRLHIICMRHRLGTLAADSRKPGSHAKWVRFGAACYPSNRVTNCSYPTPPPGYWTAHRA